MKGTLAVKAVRLPRAVQRIHYAWVTLAIAVAIRLVSSVERTASGVLVAYLVDPAGEFGWSRSIAGLALSLQWIFSGVFGPPAGWLGDRYGLRPTMAMGAGLFIVTSLLIGVTKEPWHFLVSFGVLMSASLAIFQVPLVSAVTVWFQKHLGVAMGFLQSAQGVANLIFAPLMVALLTHLGWRWAFWGPGIVGGLLLLLLIRYFYNDPAELGLRPLGAAPGAPVQPVHSGAGAKVRTQVFLKQARRTMAFWNLIGIHYWGCAGHAIIIVYLADIIRGEGLSLATGALVVGTMYGVSSFTRFVVPILADRAGSKLAMALCFFLQGLPILLLFWAHEAWQFYLFAVLMGIGFGGEMSAFPIINRQYYGNAPTGTVYGWQMFGSGIGMASGSFLGGFLRDLTGDYTLPLLASFTLSMAGTLSILILPSTSHHQLPHWEEALPPEARSSTTTRRASASGD
ncbi:MAG: MFS transporter [Candidatus Tectomicrobia bacterium]|uniref:MFS transporter n=1 Tax=Tectimicrobiota bacterium TaxID=2528274 RepID=A0A937VZE1_UNCTE|nr:MFS transporter [Candidatus Tectomicrobia bacterium]